MSTAKTKFRHNKLSLCSSVSTTFKTTLDSQTDCMIVTVTKTGIVNYILRITLYKDLCILMFNVT